jgi:DNA-directed RNA polymerase specialized sigma24 family protein
LPSNLFKLGIELPVITWHVEGAVMDPQDLDQRLSRIATEWTLVFKAHQGEVNAARAVLPRLLERYRGAAYRYLLGAVCDPDVADELAQEFALRFIRGDFHRANPERGRFRDYLKTALVNLVNDHYRQQQDKPHALGAEPAAPAQPSLNSRAEFVMTWREELLENTWKALAENNDAYHAALRYRIENPDAVSSHMAEHLSATLGKPVTPPSARKILQRAHAKFADLLLDEVAYSLENPSHQELEKELTDLDLLKYCRAALERRNLCT